MALWDNSSFWITFYFAHGDLFAGLQRLLFYIAECLLQTLPTPRSLFFQVLCSCVVRLLNILLCKHVPFTNSFLGSTPSHSHCNVPRTRFFCAIAFVVCWFLWPKPPLPSDVGFLLCVPMPSLPTLPQASPLTQHHGSNSVLSLHLFPKPPSLPQASVSSPSLQLSTKPTYSSPSIHLFPKPPLMG